MKSFSSNKKYNMNITNSLPKLQHKTHVKNNTFFSINTERKLYESNFIEALKRRDQLALIKDKKINNRLIQEVEKEMRGLNNTIKKIDEQTKIIQYKNRVLQIFGKQEDYKNNILPLRNFDIIQKNKLNNKKKSIEDVKNNLIVKSSQINRKKSLILRFKASLFICKNKLVYFKLKPHEILKYNLFAKIPYVLGIKVFKLVLNESDQQLWKLILKNRLVIYTYDLLFRTPLICAAIRGNFNILKLLIQNLSDINHIDELGNTALFYASKYGHIECLKQLIVWGCQIQTQNNRGQTALTIAKNEQTQRLIKVSLKISKLTKFRRLAPHYKLQYLEQQIIGLKI